MMNGNGEKLFQRDEEFLFLFLILDDEIVGVFIAMGRYEFLSREEYMFLDNSLGCFVNLYF